LGFFLDRKSAFFILCLSYLSSFTVSQKSRSVKKKITETCFLILAAYCRLSEGKAMKQTGLIEMLDAWRLDTPHPPVREDEM
tara:strand:- start:6200 stop:6445 length:246 start_codon:yes stop_codon:yes gene_type:complete